MFKVNEKLVYKGDVCIVKQIKEKYFNDMDYYVLSPISDLSLIINIPITCNEKEIRKIISKDEALKLIKKIPNIDIIEIENEKYIEQTYKELLNDKTYEGLVKIIKTTYMRNQKRLNNNKKISEKDDIYFKKAEQKLYDELSISLNVDTNEVKNKIINSCNK